MAGKNQNIYLGNIHVSSHNTIIRKEKLVTDIALIIVLSFLLLMSISVIQCL